jgi:hypothetical protein
MGWISEAARDETVGTLASPYAAWLAVQAAYRNKFIQMKLRYTSTMQAVDLTADAIA